MSRSRKEVEALALRNNKKKPKDYDPEDEHIEDKSDSASDVDEEVASGGREHYERVARSKLRRPEAVPLDPKYRGAVVSRKALTGEESDDDPFAPQGDDDEDEDPFAETKGTGSGESDEEEELGQKDIKALNEAPQDAQSLGENEDETGSDEEMDHFEDAGEEDEGDEGDEEDDDEGSGDDDDDISDTGSAPGVQNLAPQFRQRQELKAQLANSTLNLASGLSKAASDDVKKGQAVKKQYQTFDRLLDARIKLQKGLTATEEVAAQQAQSGFAFDAEDALRKAQEAATQLYNTINSFRDSMAKNTTPSSDSASRKRKRSFHVESLDDLDSVWHSLTELEADSLNTRAATIDRWAAKAKIADPTRNAASSKPKFTDTSNNDRLTAILDTYIINEQDKHFRSLDYGHSDSVPSNAQIPPFDDSIFYQSLLRDLITTRSAISSASNNLDIPALPSKLHPSGNKQNKKNVDTKASKGRKIRYTVHEKLQNFMASEGDTGRDTAMWTERGKNEFFGSLFGQDRALVEDDENDDMVDGVDGAGAEVEALRLFRT